MDFQDFINNLTEEDLRRINEAFRQQKNKRPVYTYSKIKDKDLRHLFNLERKLETGIFEPWFDSERSLTTEEMDFLTRLLTMEADWVKIYREEDLKIHFIAPILNRVNFKMLDHQVRDFYEEPLSYQTDSFILKGEIDFMVAEGLEYAKKPYFFIQEFKRSEEYSNPRPQLLAELISAVELNQDESIKGAYIIGAIWNFVILEKLGKDKYQYFVSSNFDSTKIDDLIGIYKNLLALREEIALLTKPQ
jgi:hypothetical protein